MYIYIYICIHTYICIYIYKSDALHEKRQPGHIIKSGPSGKRTSLKYYSTRMESDFFIPEGCSTTQY